ncbi:MAG: DUF4065 domain-containing protein, partial [Clostridiales bacterium]|nr:DUF4065 domain-containing protein [Clostridiales bacterium]
IIESYGKKYSPFQLTQLVHQDLPWLAMRKYLKFGAECRNVISKESLKEYYGMLNANNDDNDNNDDDDDDDDDDVNDGAPADNDPGVDAPKDNDPGVGAPKDNDPGIIDVAKYIIDIYGNIDPLHLEYLCYYSQAWSLAWFEVPIFDEDFYAWPQGPISPVLHEAISDYALSFDYFLDDYDENALDEKQKKCIGTVLRDLSIIPPDHFLAMPLKEDPWLRVCKKDNTLIAKETMLDYYAGQLVPREVREELENELGIHSEEENSHWKMAYDQVASVSESFDDIDEEKNKLIEERNKLIEETNKLIEEIKKLVGETNRVNVPVRRWKRTRGKLRSRSLGLCK